MFVAHKGNKHYIHPSYTNGWQQFEIKMNLDIKNKLQKLYKSSLFITLFGTTLGVLFAFYLNNINSRLKIETRTEISIQNINSELLSNKSSLESIDDNQQLIDFLTKIR
jgi:hypothetical protein